MLNYDIKSVANYKVHTNMLTDSESLFNAILKSTTKTEKYFIIFKNASREAFERNEITNIGWIRFFYNVVEDMTKTANCSALEELLNTRRLDKAVEQ